MRRIFYTTVAAQPGRIDHPVVDPSFPSISVALCPGL